MRHELPVIVNKHYLSYSWGIKAITSLKKAAVKNGYLIKLIMDESEISKLRGFSHVFVMGVDKVWINEVLALLEKNDIIGILLYSDLDETVSSPFIINTDQMSTIRLSIDHLLKNGKRNIALFGIREGDFSDAAKTSSFCEIARNAGLDVGEGDIYRYSDDIKKCFRTFYDDAKKYDAVICANDIVGVFFVNECKQMGISIPGDLFVTGNGNTWIGSHIAPSLTTIDGKADERNVFSDFLFQQYRILCNYSHVESMKILLSSDIIERESTGYSYSPVSADESAPSFGRNEIHFDFIKDPNIRQLSMLDRELSFMNNISLKIIRAQREHYSYQRTAEELYISVDTVKYRLKNIYKALNVKNRSELAFLLDKYGIIIR